ncbi:efflux RND transporter permease subunit [bacterium AH-315-I18]|nr:efflux RND transporter permease subunit [Phycisphaeraceae bacterium]MBN4061206.1 efflux RND transporter permease subunit [bacterium AH-315-I18]
MSLAGFGVRKPVPVNLLMASIILAGVFTALSMRREFFPETESDMASVSLVYPGASPEEIEDSMARKVEDTLVDIKDVDTLRTTLTEGGGGIVIEFDEGLANIRDAIDDVERKIDALQDLPDEAERITVTEIEPAIPVTRLSVFGDVDEVILKRLIRQVRDELKTLPGMGQVHYSGVRNDELRVDVNRQKMFSYGLSLPQVAQAISNWMAEVPGGTVRGVQGNVKIRTMGVDEHAGPIGQIVVKSTPKGQTILVSDIAQVHETFADRDLVTRFAGKPSVGLTVLKEGDQDIVIMADMVQAYVAARRGEPFMMHWQDKLNQILNIGKPLEKHKRSMRRQAYELALTSSMPLPAGVQIQTSSNYSRFVTGRLELLSRNAIQGAVLVFATLLFFLNWRAAFWVFMGLVTALCGTLVLMWAMDLTLNLLTMFGLIVVIGLLVDDGIVVAENIQKRHDRGEPALVAAEKGASRVAWPVVATVLTSIVAFLPLTFIKGRMGDLLGAFPWVVGCALFMSLVESLLILPSHLGHSLAKRDKHFEHKKESGMLHRFELRRDEIIFNRVVPAYGRFLELCLRHRYLSITIAIAVLIVSIGMVKGGRVAYVYMPTSDAEVLVVDIRMPIGTPVQGTVAIADLLAKAALKQPQVQSIDSIVGQRSNFNDGATVDSSSPHIAQIFIELAPVEERDVSSDIITQRIRDELKGKLVGVDSLRFAGMGAGPGGPDITIEISGFETHRMNLAVEQIKGELSRYAGVYDVSDDNELGQRELQINLQQGAAALGFTTVNLAQQIRAALYGIDAHVYTARGEDINVRVRLGDETRDNLQEIQQLWVLSPAGKAVPLSEIADIEDGLTYSTIRRVDRKRTITVLADCSPGVSPEDVVATFERDFVPDFRTRFADLQMHLGGRQERQARSVASLPYGMLAAAVMIYVILAWLFSSYLQPLVIMLAIPFSLVGVIWGHYFFGYAITFLSIIGFVALSGIVVNDSLILVEFYNDHRAKGHDMRDSLVEAGRQRLRPIVLTSLTTVLGLLPLMLEQSFQAKFLIPMAIALAGGLASATFLILLILPCVMMILDDIKSLVYYCWYGKKRVVVSTAMHHV